MDASFKKYVLIAAGGSGTRMHATQPKQFLELAGKPVLMHAIQAFLTFASDIEIVLVLDDSLRGKWKQLCEHHTFTPKHVLVAGGPTRFHSVKNGLKHIPDYSLVAIHDGVRPLVGLDTISRVFHFAGKFGSAIPVIYPTDSVRITDGAISKALHRDTVRMVQTPQCFISERLKKAYNKNYHESYTDDATVFEAEGERLFLVEGNPENIKITRASDLIYAEAIMSGKRTPA